MSAAARLAAGGVLAWSVAVALVDPGLPAPAKAAAVAVAALTAWRPAAGLVATAGLTPAGLLLAPQPAHAAELLAWSFLAAWLLPIRRPLGIAPVPRAIALPALLYGTCVVASWLALTMTGAAGVDPAALPMFLLRAVPASYLSSSAAAPETWTFLQAMTGLAVLGAAAAIAAADAATRRALAYAVAASAAALAVLTVGDVLRQWAGHGYGAPFLLRYVHGERFSLHLADLNAAGSHFVLGGLIAAAVAALDRRRRAMGIGAAAVIVPALWLTGSRSAAIGAVVVGFAAIPLARGGFAPGARARRAGKLAAPIATAAIVLALVAVARQPDTEGSASRSLRIRAQFLETSARMFASAPLTGVGVGRYHERSAGFMPPQLREVYPHENAHNYFAQQFAELGLVGGAAFLWLAIALLLAGWRAVRAQGGGDAAAAGLFAGGAGYVLTCVAGHPLLVPEAALPFWAAMGALASAGTPAGHRARSGAIAAVAAVVILGSALAVGTLAYVRPGARPPERGLSAAERLPDGTSVRRFDTHAITYVQGFRGVLIVPVRAEAMPEGAAPPAVDVEVGGWNAGRWELRPGEWIEIEVPVDRRSVTRFRRLDLRVRGDGRVLLGAPRWRPLP